MMSSLCQALPVYTAGLKKNTLRNPFSNVCRLRHQHTVAMSKEWKNWSVPVSLSQDAALFVFRRSVEMYTLTHRKGENLVGTLLMPKHDL